MKPAKQVSAGNETAAELDELDRAVYQHIRRKIETGDPADQKWAVEFWAKIRSKSAGVQPVPRAPAGGAETELADFFRIPAEDPARESEFRSWLSRLARENTTERKFAQYAATGADSDEKKPRAKNKTGRGKGTARGNNRAKPRKPRGTASAKARNRKKTREKSR